MIITIASGKGGTGKTTVAVNLALAQSQKEQLQLLDCDVEEPNSHIFLKPVFETPEKAFIPVPEVDDEKCNYCGRCKDICAFNAIAVIKENALVFPELCHGCGGCAYFCPEDAITEDPRTIGIVESAAVNGLRFVHGRLNPGEAMAPPLISAVKNKIDPLKNAIIDAPPGTSCPVVTAVKGSDFCLLVTEPTPFGLNDLSLAVEMLRKLGIPFGVLINRADSGNNCVDDYCKQEGIPVLMHFPWDIELAKLYARGEPVVPHSVDWNNRFKELWTRISEAVNTEVEKTKEERS